MKFPIKSHRIIHQIPSNIELTTSPFFQIISLLNTHDRRHHDRFPETFSPGNGGVLLPGGPTLQHSSRWHLGRHGSCESTKNWGLPEGTRPGKHTKNNGKSPFLIGRSTISMAIFNSYVNLPEGTCGINVDGENGKIIELNLRMGMSPTVLGIGKWWDCNGILTDLVFIILGYELSICLVPQFGITKLVNITDITSLC